MNFQIVSVTSQGQVTLPVKLRRALGLDKVKKAVVYRQRGKIIVEPVHSISRLAGILRNRRMENKAIEDIMELENKAIEKEMIKRANR